MDTLIQVHLQVEARVEADLIGSEFKFTTGVVERRLCDRVVLLIVRTRQVLPRREHTFCLNWNVTVSPTYGLDENGVLSRRRTTNFGSDF